MDIRHRLFPSSAPNGNQERTVLRMRAASVKRRRCSDSHRRLFAAINDLLLHMVVETQQSGAAFWISDAVYSRQMCLQPFLPNAFSTRLARTLAHGCDGVGLFVGDDVRHEEDRRKTIRIEPDR